VGLLFKQLLTNLQVEVIDISDILGTLENMFQQYGT